MRHITVLLFAALSLCAHSLVAPAVADTFGSGANTFNIEFVTVGNPGNPADTTGQPSPAGSVPYEYRIGKYEISEQMIEKASALGGLGITKDARGPDKPATSVDWFEAARFANWLNTSSGSAPAYKFVDIIGRDGQVVGTQFALWQPTDPGYDPANRFRNTQAMYFLPSVHEWYKAAFYDPAAGVYYDYPTGSNAPPIAVASGTGPGTAVLMQELSAGPADINSAGGLSPYGTMAQAGNVHEWEETALDLHNDNTAEWRGARGVGWSAFASSSSASLRFSNLPEISGSAQGFRIASIIPEPTSAALFGIGLLGLLSSTRRRHDAQHIT